MPTSTALDPVRIREDFPILAERVHGRTLTYLDNANTTQKPRAVLDAMAAFYAHDNANIHRASYLLGERATAAYEGARAKVARFVNARETAEIVLTKGCTDGLNLVAQSFARPRLRPGDEILVSWLEHHSNIVPWQQVCEATGATLRAVPISDAGELDLEAFDRALGPRTRLVSVIHVSNALGTIVPVAEIVARAHARGVPVLIDGAQAAAHLAVDVQALDCDFFAFSSHKMYGPTGSGALYGKRAWLDQMPPYQGGGDMIATVTFEKTTYAAVPHKFEAGTPNIAGVVGFGAAVDYLRAFDIEDVAAHERGLLAYATAGLRAVPGLRIIGEARERAGVISFVMDGVHPHDIGTVVDREGVALRTGQHCAQPVMDRFGVPATARASFALYNTRDDVDRLIAALDRVRSLFRMSDLRDLYQEVILDHHRRPRNYGVMEAPTGRAEGHNPLCGDRVVVYVRLDHDRIADVRFEGSGCAISKASASIMTDTLKGRSIAESTALFDAFQALVTGAAPDGHDLGKLEVFGGVRDYPSRVKCATLAWHALQAAMRDCDRVVTTETSAD